MRSFRIPLFLFCLLATAVAEEPGQPDKTSQPLFETKEFIVRLVDEKENPIQDATITGAGLRVLESPGSYFGWPVEVVGKPPSVTTDESGQATIKYPSAFGRGAVGYHTTTVCFHVEHAEFIGKHVEGDVDSSPFSVPMVPGCELVVSAVDRDRQIIDDLSVLIAGNHPTFIPGDDPGVIRSRAIPQGRRQVMLVSANRKSGEHLFSNVLSLNFAESRRVTLKGLALKPGIVVKGALAQEVPRPIKNGVVMAFSIPKTTGNIHDEDDPCVLWSSAAKVEADGSFRFASLPRQGKLQLIAICDGWVIKSEQKRGGFTTGIVRELKHAELVDNQWDGITLPMTQTASIKVTVLDQDGAPIPKARVATSPNQSVTDSGGAQVLGTVTRSADYLNRRMAYYNRVRDPLDSSSERYDTFTNGDGVATLRDVPMGTHSFIVWSEGRVLDQKVNLVGMRSVRVQLTEPGEKSVQVTMLPLRDSTDTAKP